MPNLGPTWWLFHAGAAQLQEMHPRAGSPIAGSGDLLSHRSAADAHRVAARPDSGAALELRCTLNADAMRHW